MQGTPAQLRAVQCLPKRLLLRLAAAARQAPGRAAT